VAAASAGSTPSIFFEAYSIQHRGNKMDS